MLIGLNTVFQDEDGKEYTDTVYLCAHQIHRVEPSDSGSVVTMGDGESYIVSDKPEFVYQAVNDARKES